MNSIRSFRSRVERLVREGHPDATVAFEWQHSSSVVWFDGSRGYSGVVAVSAPGYRSRIMTASSTDGDCWVK